MNVLCVDLHLMTIELLLCHYLNCVVSRIDNIRLVCSFNHLKISPIQCDCNDRYRPSDDPRTQWTRVDSGLLVT